MEREDGSYSGSDFLDDDNDDDADDDEDDGDADDDDDGDADDDDGDGHDGPQIHSKCTKQRPLLMSLLTVTTSKSIFPTSGKVSKNEGHH